MLQLSLPTLSIIMVGSKFAESPSLANNFSLTPFSSSSLLSQQSHISVLSCRATSEPRSSHGLRHRKTNVVCHRLAVSGRARCDSLIGLAEFYIGPICYRHSRVSFPSAMLSTGKVVVVVCVFGLLLELESLPRVLTRGQKSRPNRCANWHFRARLR